MVERVRVLVEGTGLSLADIGARTKIGATTVWRWSVARGWRRPVEAPRWTRVMATERSGFGPRLWAGLARVAAGAEREAGRLAEACDADGRQQALDLAAARRAERHLGRAAERDLPRMMRPPRRRDRPRRDEVFERARELVQETTLRQFDIARQLDISRVTLMTWKQTGGWVRPADAPSPFGGPARSSREIDRMQRRIEARDRLAEAEQLLPAGEGADGLDALAAAACRPAGAARRSRARPTDS